MKLLLDTHFLLWIATSSSRLKAFPWLERYRPWSISPVSLLEVQFLSEVGRVKIRTPEFTEIVSADERFLIDEVGLGALVRRALPLTWTRDPFDRLLAAHSALRRMPLCTVDRTLHEYHSLFPEELTVR